MTCSFKTSKGISPLPWYPGHEGRGYVVAGTTACGERQFSTFIWAALRGAPQTADVMAAHRIALRNARVTWATVTVAADGRAVVRDPRDSRRTEGLDQLARLLAASDDRLSVQVVEPGF